MPPRCQSAFSVCARAPQRISVRRGGDSGADSDRESIPTRIEVPTRIKMGPKSRAAARIAAAAAAAGSRLWRRGEGGEDLPRSPASCAISRDLPLISRDLPLLARCKVRSSRLENCRSGGAGFASPEDGRSGRGAGIGPGEPPPLLENREGSPSRNPSPPPGSWGEPPPLAPPRACARARAVRAALAGPRQEAAQDMHA